MRGIGWLGIRILKARDGTGEAEIRVVMKAIKLILTFMCWNLISKGATGEI